MSSMCSWETTQEFKLFFSFFRVVRLHLSTKKKFGIAKCGFIPSIRINLIYVPILDRLGYSFLFGN